MYDMRRMARQITFSGAAGVAPLADQQHGPTCGFEAVENIIQLFMPASNDLAERDLIPRAAARGVLRRDTEGVSLYPWGYPLLLGDYGISTQWYPFDFYRVVGPALWNDRVILAHGDAHLLDPGRYPRPQSWHAFIVTNFFTDETDAWVQGFLGIDSNRPNEEAGWLAANVESAVRGLPLLVTDQPVNWPIKAKHYRRQPDGQLVPVTA